MYETKVGMWISYFSRFVLIDYMTSFTQKTANFV
jgi:hypothetical protein